MVFFTVLTFLTFRFFKIYTIETLVRWLIGRNISRNRHIEYSDKLWILSSLEAYTIERLRFRYFSSKNICYRSYFIFSQLSRIDPKMFVSTRTYVQYLQGFLWNMKIIKIVHGNKYFFFNWLTWIISKDSRNVSSQIYFIYNPIYQ